MSKQGFKWELAALIAVLTLALLSAGYYVYHSFGVKRPLENVLKGDPDILSLKLVESKGTTDIVVEIGEISDLRETYTRLRGLAEDKLGPKISVSIKDTRDEDLQDAYHAVHYYLEEAATRGNFGEMIRSSQVALEERRLDEFNVTVDKERIYVQMGKNGAYLYEVLNRASGGAGGEGY